MKIHEMEDAEGHDFCMDVGKKVGALVDKMFAGKGVEVPEFGLVLFSDELDPKLAARGRVKKVAMALAQMAQDLAADIIAEESKKGKAHETN